MQELIDNVRLLISIAAQATSVILWMDRLPSAGAQKAVEKWTGGLIYLFGIDKSIKTCILKWERREKCTFKNRLNKNNLKLVLGNGREILGLDSESHTPELIILPIFLRTLEG